MLFSPLDLHLDKFIPTHSGYGLNLSSHISLVFIFLSMQSSVQSVQEQGSARCSMLTQYSQL